MPELLTSVQVAARLGKSARTIHRMVQAGVLRPVQKLPGPNGAFLFRPEDVERLSDLPTERATA